jgi:hypothetical protein
MQSCAFFWGKINMIRAYMGDSDLAIVLGVRRLVVVRRGLVFSLFTVGLAFADP